MQKKENRLQKAFNLLEDDFKSMEDEVRETQNTAENIDNTLCRHNLSFKGLKEGAERENVVQYLEDLLTACLGSDSTATVKLRSARRLGIKGRKTAGRKDRKVLLTFEDLTAKTAVLEALWDKPKLVVEGQQLIFYLNISPLTLKKCRDWQFLTSKLTQFGFPYVRLFF